MSLHIPKIALNILRIREGGLWRREEECEGARGGGEAPAAAAPLSESQVHLSLLLPLDQVKVLPPLSSRPLSLGFYASCYSQMCVM